MSKNTKYYPKDNAYLIKKGLSNAGATVALSGYIGPKAFDALQAIGIGTVQDVDNRTVGEVVRAFEAGELTVILPSNKEA